MTNYSVTGIFADTEKKFLLIQEKFQGRTQSKFPGGKASTKDADLETYLAAIKNLLDKAGFSNDETHTILAHERKIERDSFGRTLVREFLEEVGYYPRTFNRLGEPHQKPDRRPGGGLYFQYVFEILELIAPRVGVITILPETNPGFQSSDQNVCNTQFVVPASKIREKVISGQQKSIDSMMLYSSRARDFAWVVQ